MKKDDDEDDLVNFLLDAYIISGLIGGCVVLFFVFGKYII